MELLRQAIFTSRRNPYLLQEVAGAYFKVHSLYSHVELDEGTLETDVAPAKIVCG
jgi:hypothetical protein